MTRILVVEDSVTQQLLLKGILEKSGYAVTTADNGQEGLRTAQRSLPDLIITDIRMPDMDGYEMCWRIKNDPDLKRIPVILLSGLSDIEDIVLGLEALGDGYIIKPFEEADILRNIDMVLANRRTASDDEQPLPLQHNGDTYAIRSNRQQILNFLLSVYDSAIHRNTRLQEIQTQLRVINEQLTERTRDLEASETRFRALAQTAPDIIYRIDTDGYFIFVNHSIRKLGYEPEELVGKHFSELIAPAEIDRISRRRVLPRFRGQSSGDGQSPKLFDEKRTGQRKTIGLEVQLRSKRPSDEMIGKLEPISPEFLVFEVNSAGMYQLNQSDQRLGTFIGTVGVIRDITERKQAARALHQAKEEAIQASRAKSEFLSRMSHELRTPLNVILGFGQLLEANTVDPLAPSQREPVQQIMEAGHHLLELINELLDLARIESGKTVVQMETIDPSTVLHNCLTMSQPLARARLVSLIHPCEDNKSLPAIHIDARRFKQVLLNLLANAIKFNKKGGWVTLDCAILPGGQLEISVQDTGSGIPEARRHELFEPFSRLSGNLHAIEGSGIGLTIAKRLVEMMSGEIGFESQEGKGSRFWVRFPIVDRAPATREESEPAPPAPPPAESTPGAPPRRPRRVLLYVEDNLANARLMREIINRHPDLSLIHTATAEEGIELTKSREPDLVIMDITLPGMDGYEALDQLRQLPETSHIPVIALTADATPEKAERAEKAGFKRYLVKPVQVNRLMEAIDQFLDREGS